MEIEPNKVEIVNKMTTRKRKALSQLNTEVEPSRVGVGVGANVKRAGGQNVQQIKPLKLSNETEVIGIENKENLTASFLLPQMLPHNNKVVNMVPNETSKKHKLRAHKKRKLEEYSNENVSELVQNIKISQNFATDKKMAQSFVGNKNVVQDNSLLIDEFVRKAEDNEIAPELLVCNNDIVEKITATKSEESEISLDSKEKNKELDLKFLAESSIPNSIISSQKPTKKATKMTKLPEKLDIAQDLVRSAAEGVPIPNVVENPPKPSDEFEFEKSEVETKRELTAEQKLECLMIQIDSLFQCKTPSPINTNIRNPEIELTDKLSGSVVNFDTFGMIQIELNKEQRYSLPIAFPTEFVDKRRQTVQTMISSARKNKLDDETLHLCVYIFDAFFLKAKASIRRNIDWTYLGITSLCIATKMNFINKIPNEFYTFVFNKHSGSKNTFFTYSKIERLILRVLQFQICPPTVNIFRELVIDQMDFPSPMTKWLISQTASKVLRDSLIDYKLISIPASQKSKSAIQICTKYYMDMDHFESFHFLQWNPQKNCPFESDAYIKALITLAISRCYHEFSDFFTVKKIDNVPEPSKKTESTEFEFTAVSS